MSCVCFLNKRRDLRWCISFHKVIYIFPKLFFIIIPEINLFQTFKLKVSFIILFTWFLHFLYFVHTELLFVLLALRFNLSLFLLSLLILPSYQGLLLSRIVTVLFGIHKWANSDILSLNAFAAKLISLKLIPNWMNLFFRLIYHNPPPCISIPFVCMICLL